MTNKEFDENLFWEEIEFIESHLKVSVDDLISTERFREDFIFFVFRENICPNTFEIVREGYLRDNNRRLRGKIILIKRKPENFNIKHKAKVVKHFLGEDLTDKNQIRKRYKELVWLRDSINEVFKDDKYSGGNSSNDSK